MKERFIFCEVRTESLYVTQINFGLEKFDVLFAGNGQQKGPQLKTTFRISYHFISNIKMKQTGMCGENPVMWLSTVPADR
jgi:hypothetical protein